MDRKLWASWSSLRAEQCEDRPWLLSKWETLPGVLWSEEKIQIMIDDIKAKLGLEPDHWLLDVGCGPGWIGSRLKPLAAEVVGVDFAPAMLACSAKNSAIIPLMAEARALPFDENVFPRVMIYFCLMNFTDQREVVAAIRESLRVTRPGGLLLVGQMPLKSRSKLYDLEKRRYLDYCRSAFELGEDTRNDHAPPIVLFEDDFAGFLSDQLSVAVEVYDSFNHFWREGEPLHCSWRADYLLRKEAP